MQKLELFKAFLVEDRNVLKWEVNLVGEGFVLG